MILATSRTSRPSKLRLASSGPAGGCGGGGARLRKLPEPANTFGLSASATALGASGGAAGSGAAASGPPGFGGTRRLHDASRKAAARTTDLAAVRRALLKDSPL